MEPGDFQYLRERVDGIAETLAKNTVILEKNTESLQEHMRRTALLEEMMEVALLPIKVAKVLGYILGLLTAAAGVMIPIWQIIKSVMSP